DELAPRVAAHAGSLYRLLRALASFGIFSEDSAGRFSLTPLARLLCSDSPEKKRAFARLIGAEFYEAWGHLLESVKTGQAGFQRPFGATLFEYLTSHPDRAALFDAMMTGVHAPETEPVLDAYDFSVFGTVADIGGGNGLTLLTTLKRHPRLKGILFDLPNVA